MRLADAARHITLVTTQGDSVRTTQVEVEFHSSYT